MRTEDRTVKKNPVEMPVALEKEIIRMRRIPSEFAISRVGDCRLCKNKPDAIFLTHPLCEHVACWCPVHGFLYFESPRVPPAGEQIPKQWRRAA